MARYNGYVRPQRSPEALEHLMVLRMIDYYDQSPEVRRDIDSRRVLSMPETFDLFMKARRGEIDLS